MIVYIFFVQKFKKSIFYVNVSVSFYTNDSAREASLHPGNDKCFNGP